MIERVGKLQKWLCIRDQVCNALVSKLGQKKLTNDCLLTYFTRTADIVPG